MVHIQTLESADPGCREETDWNLGSQAANVLKVLES